MLVVLVMLPGVAMAQDNCFPADDSHEAQTFGILSAPLAFTGAGGMGARTAIGIEATTIPKVPDEIATPTSCRPGKGPENTNPLPGFARVRVEVAFGAWRVDAGWIPPVRVEGVRSNLIGFGLSRTMMLGSGWRLTPRAHALVGRVHGPFTCDEEALADAGSECFEGTLSDDRWEPNIMGLGRRSLERAVGCYPMSAWGGHRFGHDSRSTSPIRSVMSTGARWRWIFNEWLPSPG
jgi:hypothetical protein